ncbi:AfsR/SARP family transcriptional regulator [Actinomadura rupiterrae]|uniref:AfsR/SARP family transcriptional regulator n=1 Tax=Actinomadura rupiterrae TaxID=559627 RepID=UPI0020A4F703|nr:BTAD domain-containing putative transcriptional regulator [Actinomadura rupiterrae]MCP2341843.1 DNA-binding SARP family transcriptional activator [Actinomadura rupiterrae]
MTSTRLRFTLLGPPAVRRGDVRLGTGSPQQGALLAALLLRGGRPAGIDDLVAALWDGPPPARAVGMIRTYVSRLRLVLEDDRARPALLVSVGPGYALRVPPEDVDSVEFERLVRDARDAAEASDHARARRLLLDADTLWGGEPLAGLPGPSAAAHRERLCLLRLDALEARFAADLALGHHAQAAVELAALTAAHPLRERLHELRMLALYRSGRRAEALEAYTTARRSLAAELDARPGQPLQDLHQRILRATPDEPEETPHAVSVSETTLRREEVSPDVPMYALPRAVPDFVGRARELACLRTTLTEPDRGGRRGRAPVIVTLAGGAGVGKTALALQVAHDVAESFPDGVLYADLGGGGEDAVDPYRVLAGFLRRLGVPDAHQPDDPASAAALFRSCLADRKVLVVLDNAGDTTRLRPLLPGGAGCAVLIAGRARPAALPVDRHLDLGTLDRGDALALFAGIAGTARTAAERSAAEELLRLCDRLPLAVRIVASRLAEHPNWTVESLLARIADGRRRLAELRLGGTAVESTFRVAYDRLDAGQARAFRLLALSDAPVISAGTAAALLGTDEEEAEELADSLVELGMLASPAPRRYRFHNLSLLFARELGERLGPDERRAAYARLLDYHLAAQREALVLLGESHALAARTGPPRFPSANAASQWTTDHLSELLALVTRHAADPVPPLDGVAELTLALAQQLDDGPRWMELVVAARALLDAGVARGNRRAEMAGSFVLGYHLIHCVKQPGGQQLVGRAVELCRELGDESALAEALSVLALDAFYRRDHAVSLARCKEVLAIDIRMGNVRGQATRMANIAQLHLAAGDRTAALAAGYQGLALARRADAPVAVAYALYLVGQVLGALDRHVDALAAFDEALTVCWTHSLPLREAQVLMRMAEARLALGQFRDAADTATQSLAVARVIGGDWQQARTRVVLGRAWAALGQTSRAHREWRAALAMFTDLGVPEADDVRALLASSDQAPTSSTCAR